MGVGKQGCEKIEAEEEEAEVVSGGEGGERGGFWVLFGFLTGLVVMGAPPDR